MGALVGVADVATAEAVEEAIRTRVPKGTEELNLKAFRLGLERGREAKARHEAS